MKHYSGLKMKWWDLTESEHWLAEHWKLELCSLTKWILAEYLV
ncbi:MAG: hypothetical protein WB588_08740 [Dehalococcoidia bacterium]